MIEQELGLDQGGMIADSIQRAADSLEALRIEALLRAEAIADSLREVAEREVFGVSSQLFNSSSIGEQSAELMESVSRGGAWHDIVVLILLGLYIIWLNGFVGDIKNHSKGSAYNSEPQSKNSLQGYIGGHLLTYILVVSTMTLMLSNLLGHSDWRAIWQIIIGWHILFGVETLMVRVASFLSYDESMFGETMLLKMQYWITTMVWTLPILLMFSSAFGLRVNLYVTIIQTIAVLCGYIFTSLRLFVSKKISILNWFLYLCGVEMLPKILLWTFLIRNLSVI